MIAGIVSIPLVITVVGSALVGFGAVVVAIAALSRIRAHPERSGRGMAITGLVTGVVGLGLTILFVIALSGDDDTNELDTVEYTELSPGDCFERSPAFPSGVALEDCRFAHDREVVGVVEHPASFDAPFPGRRALDDRARELCLPLFEDYLGPDREAAIVALETLQPTPSAWGEGNRRIVCAVERTDDEKLVGSVKDGSGPFRY